MHAEGSKAGLGFRELRFRLGDLPDLEFAVEGHLSQFGEEGVVLALLRPVGTPLLGLLQRILQTVVYRVEGC